MTASTVPATADTPAIATEIQEFLWSVLTGQLHLMLDGPETDLIDGGLLDSLGLVDLFMAIEKKFGIKLSAQDFDIEHFRTVITMVAFVQEQLRTKGAQAAAPQDPAVADGPEGRPGAVTRLPTAGPIASPRPEEIPAIADLHRRVFGTGAEGDGRLQEAYGAYFQRVFFSEGAEPLVYRNPDGKIVGFIGIRRHRWLIDGQPISGAVSSQLVVDPAARGEGVGARLLEAFLEGPHDLVLADEAGTPSRHLWEALGGTTAFAHSFYWMRPLRPFSLGSWFLQERPRLHPLAPLARPLAGVLDGVLGRWPERILRVPVDGGALTTVPFDGEQAAAELPRLLADRRLAPAHDRSAFTWLLERMEEPRDAGPLEKVMVQDGQGALLGWYLYRAPAGGVGRVAALVAPAEHRMALFAHLLRHAYDRGVAALAGRVDPAYLEPLRRHHALMHRNGPWVLVSSRRPEIAAAIHQGQAYLSQLEGECPLRFVLPPV